MNGKASQEKRKYSTYARCKNLLFSNNAELFNALMPWWAAFTLVGCVACLYPYVDDIWSGWSHTWKTCIRLSTWVLIVQSLVNWWFLRTTRSFFRPSQCDEAEMRRLCAESDSLSMNVINPSKRALPTDELNSDVMGSYKNTKLYAVYIPEPDGSKSVRMYPYFTWRPCISCNTYRPPRAHHCPLCRRCVLKRDHHCFFAGSCVGLHNQRFFVAFTFWAALLATFGLVNTSVYAYTQIKWQLWDIVLPLVFFRWWFNFISFLKLMIVLLLCSLLFLSPSTTLICYGAIRLACGGKTTFEIENQVNVIDTRPVLQRLKAAFGQRWWLIFLIPSQKLYPVQDDGIHWPTIKHRDS